MSDQLSIFILVLNILWLSFITKVYIIRPRRMNEKTKCDIREYKINKRLKDE